MRVRRVNSASPRAALLAALVVVVVVLVLVFVFACSTVRVHQDYDPDVDFSAYATYAWWPAPPVPTGNVRLDNPLLHNRIRAAIDRSLAAKGLRQVVDATPDLFVNYHLSMEQKLDVYTVDRYYAGGPYGGRWGGYGWGGPGWSETRVDQYDEGTMVIDLVDSAGRELVWRGTARGRIREDPGPEKSTERVNQVVAEIFAQFPPS